MLPALDYCLKCSHVFNTLDASGSIGVTERANYILRVRQQAVAIAKANAKNQSAPVQLAPTPGVGEVAWKTPIVKNSMTVPIKDKVDLLMQVNAAALGAGANFVNSMLFLVNEQKYFASTDGSYIDQDIHRIWAPMTVTAIDKATGKFVFQSTGHRFLATPCVDANGQPTESQTCTVSAQTFRSFLSSVSRTLKAAGTHDSGCRSRRNSRLRPTRVCQATTSGSNQFHWLSGSTRVPTLGPVVSNPLATRDLTASLKTERLTPSSSHSKGSAGRLSPTG